MKKFKPWLIALLILGGIGYWIYSGITKPLPGEAVADIGAEHTTDIAEVVYNSNPPTSGQHFSLWAKSGIYDRFISDGYLLHSMEHGYIIISYDCTKSITNFQFPSAKRQASLISNVLAHSDEAADDATESGKPLMHMTAKVEAGTSWITTQNQPEIEVELPESFKTDSCKSLVNQLSEFTKVAQRVIVVPRQGMDTPIALTAWGRILKLQNVDKEAIENFINTFHNRGPEQTME